MFYCPDRTIEVSDTEKRLILFVTVVQINKLHNEQISLYLSGGAKS